MKPELILKYPRIFLNHDKYERHHWTVKFLGKPEPGQTIIDVGGERLLNLFAKGMLVHDVNTVGPDAIKGGIESLPYKCYDYAVSLDTLEHMPSEERGEFLQQLIRLARRRVVFCAPIGQPMQIEMQKKYLAAGGLDETTVRYLNEHLEYGMPTPEELHRKLPDVKIDWFYSGNVNAYPPPKIPKSRILQKGLTLIGFFVNWLFNLTWLHTKVSKKRKPETNRFYGVIDLTGNQLPPA